MKEDIRFDPADTLLARSGRRLVPVATGEAPRPRWEDPEGVVSRRYRTDPDSGVSVFVYAFASEAAALAAEPTVKSMVLDGTRAAIILHGALIFWLEAPVSLPGRPLALETNQTFDAIAAALR